MSLAEFDRAFKSKVGENHRWAGKATRGLPLATVMVQSLMQSRPKLAGMTRHS